MRVKKLVNHLLDKLVDLSLKFVDLQADVMELRGKAFARIAKIEERQTAMERYMSINFVGEETKTIRPYYKRPGTPVANARAASIGDFEKKTGGWTPDKRSSFRLALIQNRTAQSKGSGKEYWDSIVDIAENYVK